MVSEQTAVSAYTGCADPRVCTTHLPYRLCFSLQPAQVLFFLSDKEQSLTLARVLWLRPLLRARTTSIKVDGLTGHPMYRKCLVDSPERPALVPVTSIVSVEHFSHACKLRSDDSTQQGAGSYCEVIAGKVVHSFRLNPVFLRVSRVSGL